jgi:hypothetical protein
MLRIALGTYLKLKILRLKLQLALHQGKKINELMKEVKAADKEYKNKLEELERLFNRS